MLVCYYVVPLISQFSVILQLKICMLIFQKVRQRYELWNEDQTTFEIVIDHDTSPAIEMDQQVEIKIRAMENSYSYMYNRKFK